MTQLKRKRYFIGFLVFGVIVLLPILVAGYSAGPPDAHTGAPSETTCRDCHGTAVGTGSLTIIGVPAQYNLRQTYTLTATIQNAAQKRWGFELTAVDAAAKGAGQFTSTDIVNTQLSDNAAPARDYVKQTTTGTFNNTLDGPVSWNFDWKAPAVSVHTITFYVAGNAANGNFTTTGDFIYTTSVAAASASCCDLPGDANNNGLVNIQDVTYMIKFLYQAGPPPPCLDEANVNGFNPLNIQDVTYLIKFLYQAGTPPVCP
ncbi:MAG: hypothetical protein NT002_08985 [candidate division Zixibacteria bacterium]|nr:hypothetical protein [candidate division Zixibacteria bacterium]